MRCLFGASRSTREFFHSYGNFTITDEVLQRLIYVRHLWRLRSEGSLACHTYTVTQGIPSNGQLQGPVTLTRFAERLAAELLLPVVSQSVLTT